MSNIVPKTKKVTLKKVIETESEETVYPCPVCNKEYRTLKRAEKCAKQKEEPFACNVGDCIRLSSYITDYHQYIYVIVTAMYHKNRQHKLEPVYKFKPTADFDDGKIDYEPHVYKTKEDLDLELKHLKKVAEFMDENEPTEVKSNGWPFQYERDIEWDSNNGKYKLSVEMS